MAQFNGETEGKAVVEAFAKEVEGKTFLITGPSPKGIGAETALSLATANPKRIILAGRSETKIQPVMDQIKRINPEVDILVVTVDLSDNTSVQHAAEKINSSIDRLDVLVNNAGVMAIKDYTKSVDGFEMHFASNHLGHFLLTNLLMSKIIAAKGVIVNVSSTGHELAEVNFDDPNFQGGKTYNPWVAYAQSKTANILFSVALTEKLKTSSVVSFSLCPGLILESQLQSNTGVTNEMFMEGYKIAVERNPGKDMNQIPRTLQQGCATILYAALNSSLREKAPAHLKECSIVPAKDYASNKADAEKLWTLSERMIGYAFDP